MPPFTPRAIAFDLDGLMFDTEQLFVRVASEMLAERGKVFTPEILAQMIGRQWAVAGPAFKEMAALEEPLDELLAEKMARTDALLDTAVHPTPGLFALISQIEHRAIPRSLATSSRRAYAVRLLTRHNLLHHFAFLLTAEDVTHSKPDPEIYLKSAQGFGIPPSDLLVLEDSPAGVQAARAAGAFVVAIPHEHSHPQGLEAANLILPRLDDPDLLALIQNHPTEGA